MSQHRVSWEKDALVLAFRSYLAPSLTLPCEYSGLFMIQMPCIEHLLKAQAVWGWSPWEVSSFSPSSSCFLVSQSWFHLRSSCLCCNLITLNFLEGERHVISWRLILVCTVWKFPLISVMFKMFLFVGESGFPFFLLSVTALADAIPRYNICIHCENGPLSLSFPLRAISTGTSLSYWNLYWSISVHSKESCMCIHLYSVSLDTFVV